MFKKNTIFALFALTALMGVGSMQQAQGMNPKIKGLIWTGALAFTAYSGYSGYRWMQADKDLLAAIEKGDVEGCKNALKWGANVHRQIDTSHKNLYYHWGTPLHWACEKGNYEIVELLLEKGADVNARTYHGATPLHIASKKGYYDIVKLLIKKGAKFRFEYDILHNTPLSMACENGHLSIMRLLIDADAGGVNDMSGQPFATYLYRACEYGATLVVWVLLEKGADVQYSTMDRQTSVLSHNTPLHAACARGYREIVELLLEKGATIDRVDKNNFINKRDDSGHTPLWHAYKNKYFAIMELLIDKGADIHAHSSINGIDNDGGLTLLHEACRDGDLTAITLLLKKGANVEALNNLGETPLFCGIDSLDVVRLLFAKGAQVNPRASSLGDTPLSEACDEDTNGDNLDVVKFLIAHGANITDQIAFDYQNLINQVPQICRDLGLFYAAPEDFKRRISQLVEKHGGQVLAQLRAEAKKYDCKEIGRWLLNAKKQVFCLSKLVVANKGLGKDREEKLPWAIAQKISVSPLVNINATLLRAAETGDVDLCKAALGWGADINVTDNRNQTALYAACANGQLGVVKLLIDAGALCDHGQVEALHFILSRTRERFTGFQWSQSPLHIACEKNYDTTPDIIKTLLLKNPRINQQMINSLGVSTRKQLLINHKAGMDKNQKLVGKTAFGTLLDTQKVDMGFTFA